MPVLNKIAFFQNRRDEVPNQALAQELARTRNPPISGKLPKACGTNNPTSRAIVSKCFMNSAILRRN